MNRILSLHKLIVSTLLSCWFTVPLLLAVNCCAQETAATQDAPAVQRKPIEAGTEKAESSHSTETLFDGKTLDGWELTSFGGEGECYVEDGVIVMNAGDPVTAINLPESRELPTSDYELLVEAKKIEGSDFFSTLTFPVNDSFCSLVVGGWGGTLIGLSSIDGKDASRNETRTLKKFEKGQWYQIRVRVRPDAITCWIDDEKVVDQNIVGKKISLRNEMIPCRPLGIASFITTAAIGKVELKTIPAK